MRDVGKGLGVTSQQPILTFDVSLKVQKPMLGGFFFLARIGDTVICSSCLISLKVGHPIASSLQIPTKGCKLVSVEISMLILVQTPQHSICTQCDFFTTPKYPKLLIILGDCYLCILAFSSVLFVRKTIGIHQKYFLNNPFPPELWCIMPDQFEITSCTCHQ